MQAQLVGDELADARRRTKCVAAIDSRSRKSCVCSAFTGRRTASANVALWDAVPLLRESSFFDDRRLLGPHAARAWVSATRDGPGDLTVDHAEWVRGSGIAVAHIHFVLCEVLRVAIWYDNVGISNLVSFDIIRCIIHNETAVGLNTRRPD